MFIHLKVTTGEQASLLRHLQGAAGQTHATAIRSTHLHANLFILAPLYTH